MDHSELVVANGLICIVGARPSMVTAAFGAFLRNEISGTPRFVQILELTESKAQFSSWQQGQVDFEYERHDLKFGVRNGRCYGWSTGEESGLLALAELAMWWAVENAGGFMLHASAGVRYGLAWIMPGPSGTGKSTAARGGFERVLSDERVIIMPDESSSQYMAWGTPFWSDGRDQPMDTGSAPIQCVARLHHGRRSRMRALTMGELAPWVLRSTISYSHEATHLVRNFEAVCAFTESVTGVHLTYPKEGSWVSSTPLPIGLAS